MSGRWIREWYYILIVADPDPGCLSHTGLADQASMIFSTEKAGGGRSWRRKRDAERALAAAMRQTINVIADECEVDYLLRREGANT